MRDDGVVLDPAEDLGLRAVRPPYLGESSVFGRSPLTAVTTSFLPALPRDLSLCCFHQRRS